MLPQAQCRNMNIKWLWEWYCIIYTKLDGSSQIWARQSTDGGTTYGAEFRVNPDETVNQYGFDLKGKMPAGSGFSFVYHADSTQMGPASSMTDKLQFGSALQSGSTFQPFEQINQVLHFSLLLTVNRSLLNYQSTAVQE